MKLFVGLGNPGAQYARQRHNVGFMALDRIAQAHGFSPWRKRFQGETSEGTLGGERVVLLKPSTYMNESGRSVREAASFLKIPLDDISVFHDEIDLAPAKLKVKAGGGNAGHNGLRSISAHLGNDYTRVRIGVGHPGAKDAVAHYVLHDFARVEYEWLDPMLDAMADAAPWLAKGDAARFLSQSALKMQGGAAEPEAVAPERPAKLAAAKPRKSGGGGHPAGERASKSANALAENLKKWLAGRGDKE